ncbi:MAG: 3,4-dihydroxy-2-butanone-4-phosphate synthase, partial [Stellaceae bacterium]
MTPIRWLNRTTNVLVGRLTKRSGIKRFDRTTSRSHGRESEIMSHTEVPQVIDAFARGEIVVVTDDNDRENEGDLILAAAHATPEKMAFIIRNTCGIVCAPLTGEIARRLHLAPMVADNDAIHGTAFTVSV